ncbi:LacI family DNA-binding transcriptional regulator [Streptomyces caniscabiei]|uniref:LacI family DNA-binding transcriptional regulator n=2 Tax=Streptomyces caniscabiei TaxID=2746961 RepID=A0A927L947_9ACTN|nr:LacI family DNA-binding transcriptional regulator [Streptomyces caniscabiei]MBD9726339.1 LacI family DNA-binding transcriptional regulator [Streptomyces caniscabiei]MDX3511808.1 LacI family DNA-binding transcriptional regulator [Streptomyces caniscabiei]MDX3719357.1 LacI family DNA-binding transcriptional regulator [Streptomyces caniscabiei]MDX3726173.1 LacI family DNA-binding transcriptional regulator [Streptomyces caniscabiei]WEO29504.1 LacI family DNA-binding transcriptional regulator [S
MTGTSSRRRVTGADVAREAGVSRATVSYVLNDVPHQKIPEATRQRVWEAAARLGYAPSAAARSLRMGRSEIVLGLLPDWPIEHVLGRFVQQLTNAFAEHGLTFVVHSPARPARPFRETWKAITPAAVLALDDIPESEAVAMRAAGIEVAVALHGSVQGRYRPPLVSEEPVGEAQARHLVGSHRRIGYAYPDLPQLVALAEPRLDGVRKVCAELGLPEPDVRTVPVGAGAAMKAVQAWLAADPPVTGICAFNDDVAMSVLVALRSLGLRAPQDLAVIGVDDIPGAALAQPPLTTIVRDTDAIARGLARRIVDTLGGTETGVEPIRVPLRVRDRASA